MIKCNTQAMTRQQQQISGGHLAHRSRGVTTFHHYERISSRDLEWHRRENGREREEVKLSCFFDKRVKPKNLEKVTQIQEKNTTKVNKVENTPLEKRDKEHCENLEVEGKIYIENTPVKEGDQGRPNSNITPVEKRCKT